MSTQREPKMVDRSGSRLRMAGAGALLAVTVAAAVIPDSTPARASTEAESNDPLALRRSDAFRLRFPDYPGAVYTPMGRLEMNGNPTELHTFRSPDSIGRVVNHYARAFSRTGRHVAVDGDETAATVSYYDESMGELIAVHAIKQGDGTLAFPSIMDASNGLRIAPELPEQLPLAEGAVTVSRVDDHTPGPSAMSSSIAQMLPGTPEEAAVVMEKAMVERGYRSAGDSRGSAFVKQGEKVTVSYIPVDKPDGAETAVFILLERAP